MINFPRLKTFLCVFPLSDSTWGLRGGADELWRLKLTDERAVRAFGALLPYLDGRTAAPDILQRLGAAGVHVEAAAAVLRQLEASTLIEDADPHGLSEAQLQRHAGQIRFFSHLTQRGGAVYQAAVCASRVALVADGLLGASLYRQLAQAGFGEVLILCREPKEAQTWVDAVTEEKPRTTIVELDPQAPLPAQCPDPRVLVAAQDAHDPLLLEALDRLSKERGLPWLLVRLIDLREGWVGPLFVPGESASYLSLEARLRSNMQRFQEYQAFDAHVRRAGPPPALGGLRAAGDLLASVATIELMKFVSEVKVPELMGKFLSVNLWTWETELHEVLRLPNLDREMASRPVVFPWKVLSNDSGAAPSGRV